MNLLLEAKKLSYIKEEKKEGKEGKEVEGINGIPLKKDKVQEDGGMLAAAAVPAAIIGWQGIRHKIGM